jgi:hypothetical protein
MISPIQTLSIAYLCAPVVLFFLGFYRFEFGLPLAILLLVALAATSASTDWSRTRASLPTVAVLLPVTLLWFAPSGVLAPTIRFPSDWDKHYALLHILSDQPWPVTFEGWHLRYSLAWYLVPAVIAKFLGPSVLAWCVALWTALGLSLGLGLVCERYRSGYPQWIAVAVVIAAGGLDAIGTAITGYARGPALHLEWWAEFGQIPGVTASVLWAPQHAIPALIVAALLAARDLRPLVPVLGLPLAAAALWSPFAVIGVAPLALVSCPHI